MVVFGKAVVFRQKWLYLVKSGFILVKVVVLGQKDFYSCKVVVFGQRGSVRAKWLYSGKVVVLWQSFCNRARNVVFGQKWLYSGKVVLFEQKWL